MSTALFPPAPAAPPVPLPTGRARTPFDGPSLAAPTPHFQTELRDAQRAAKPATVERRDDTNPPPRDDSTEASPKTDDPDNDPTERTATSERQNDRNSAVEAEQSEKPDHNGETSADDASADVEQADDAESQEPAVVANPQHELNVTADEDASATPATGGVANQAAETPVAATPDALNKKGNQPSVPTSPERAGVESALNPAEAVVAPTPNQDAASNDSDEPDTEPKAQTPGTKASSVQNGQASTTATSNSTAGLTVDATASSSVLVDATSRGTHEAGARAAGPAQAPPPTESSPSDDINQARLARGLRTALNQQGGAVTLRLTPPEMGTVRIQMQLQGAAVSAQFHAESDAARSMLQQQLGQLRTALESQGLTVDRLGVQSMNQGNASSFGQTQDQSDPQQQTHDGRSRGQYQPQHRTPDDASGDNPTEAPADFTELLDTAAG